MTPDSTNSDQASKMPAGIGAAFRCGIYPLLLTALFQAFRMATQVEDDGIMLMFAAVLGLPFTVFGLLSVARFQSENRRRPEILARWRSSAHWAVFLILANYPVALGFSFRGFYGVAKVLQAFVGR